MCCFWYRLFHLFEGKRIAPSASVSSTSASEWASPLDVFNPPSHPLLRRSGGCHELLLELRHRLRNGHPLIPHRIHFCDDQAGAHELLLAGWKSYYQVRLACWFILQGAKEVVHRVSSSLEGGGVTGNNELKSPVHRYALVDPPRQRFWLRHSNRWALRLRSKGKSSLVAALQPPKPSTEERKAYIASPKSWPAHRSLGTSHPDKMYQR